MVGSLSGTGVGSLRRFRGTVEDDRWLGFGDGNRKIDDSCVDVHLIMTLAISTRRTCARFQV